MNHFNSRWLSYLFLLLLAVPQAFADTRFTFDAGGSVENLQNPSTIEIGAGKTYAWNGREPVALFQNGKPPVVVIPSDFKGDLSFNSPRWSEAFGGNCRQTGARAVGEVKLSPSYTGISSTIELETQLQHKLRSLLPPSDPLAFAAVNFRQERLKVDIFSQAELPAELRKILSEAIPGELNQKAVEYHQLSPVRNVTAAPVGVSPFREASHPVGGVQSSSCDSTHPAPQKTPIAWVVATMIAVLWALYSTYRLKKIS